MGSDGGDGQLPYAVGHRRHRSQWHDERSVRQGDVVADGAKAIGFAKKTHRAAWWADGIV